jgi:SAM-dependent methyltransferase
MQMETIEGSIYDWPKYYDLVYGSDWKAECGFLERCFEEFASGPVKRLFEPACGTGRLLFRLARRGYEVGGIDLNPRATAYCRQRFRRQGLRCQVQTGDMCCFATSHPWHAAFNTINSFRHLMTDDLARRHLKCMAGALQQGGIYVLGLHLTPTACEPDSSESWCSRRGHLQINTSMWLLDRNLPQRRETYAITFDVYTPTRQFRIRDELRFRTWTVDQWLRLLDRTPEFRLAATYDFAYDQPIELGNRTQDAVFVLQRR